MSHRQTNIKSFLHQIPAKVEIKIEKNIEIDDETLQITLNNIKEEPPVEFVLVLPRAEIQVERPKLDEKVLNIYNNRVSKKSTKSIVKCKICLKGFLQIHLKRHLKTHTKSKQKFQCDFCLKVFDLKCNLAHHMKRKHLKPQCLHCNESFDAPKLFREHLKVHSIDSHPLKCDHCPKSFFQKHNLCYHLLRTHSTVRKLKCNECKFETINVFLLNHHKKSHSKLIGCNLCGAKFSYAATLKVHKQNVHASTKNVNCELCDAKFTSVTYMKKHIQRTHGKIQKIATTRQPGLNCKKARFLSRYPNQPGTRYSNQPGSIPAQPD